MKLTDYLFIIKNRILKKDNIILVIIISFILVAMFSCITMINFITTFKTSMLSNELGRTLIINKPSSNEEYNKIKELKHIEVIESKKYLYGVEIDVPEFNKPKAEGVISLLPLLKESDIKIVKGSKLKNPRDIVCPQKFYPHSLYIDDGYGLKIDYFKSYILKANNLIGNIITTKSDTGKIDLKIVGSFENKVLNELYTCYISKDDFDKFKSDIEVCSGDECYEYNSLILRIDNHKNISTVEEELKKLGYHATKTYTVDEATLYSLTYIPLFIGSIVIIISMLIIYIFYKKKIRNNKYQYGILKSVGFKNKIIRNIAVLEGIIINVISIIFSLILYSIGYAIVIEKYLKEFTHSNFNPPIPWGYLGIFIFLMFIFIYFVISKICNKSLNSCIQKLFEGE